MNLLNFSVCFNPEFYIYSYNVVHIACIRFRLEKLEGTFFEHKSLGRNALVIRKTVRKELYIPGDRPIFDFCKVSIV